MNVRKRPGEATTAAVFRFALLALLAGPVGAWWWRRRPFRVAVEGTSMAPTLLPGDFLVAVCVPPSRLRRGDLVVVEHPLRPGVEMVKRLTGLPGDEVGIGGGYVLGPDELWIAGDDPASSTDSRRFGPVSSRLVRGVVRLRYWPRPTRFTHWPVPAQHQGAIPRLNPPAQVGTVWPRK